jgi:hypothetical protein
MDVLIVPRRRGGETFDATKMEIFMPSNPISLRPTEELTAVASEDATGASTVNVLVALGPSVLPPMPVGDVRMVRFTGSTTLTAGAWTSVTVTPEQSLEPGTYVLVGFVPISAGCIAARVIFPAGQFRPGVLGVAGTEAAAVDFDPARYEGIMFYPMGTFTHLQLPIFQFLSSSADTSEVVIAHVVKTG